MTGQAHKSMNLKMSAILAGVTGQTGALRARGAR